MNQTAKTIPVAELEKFCLTALRKCGLSEADARTTTNVLVTTDTFGVFTHGVKCLKGYVRRLRGGGLKADAAPRIQAEGPGWAIVNGQSAIAMVTSVFAMNTAIQKARTTGIAYVGVQNSCHFGAAGYYVNMAAQADMIGLAMANDIPSMVIPGAKKAVLGTNPFSYAVPAGEESPIFLDIASSTVAGGKVYNAQAQHKEIPADWLVDADGLPTTDPMLYPSMAALVPFAGHKGYGIALMIEIFAGALAGGAMRWDIRNWIESDASLPTHHGAAFLAINVGAITPIDAFKKRIDQLIRDIRDTPKAKGVERIYVPGEREWQNRRESLASGVALPEDVMTRLRDLASELDIQAL